jgi:threonine/homoserine/homoserine lactone efflux protein
MSLEFWMTSLVVVLVPGTGVIYTVSSGLTGGFKKSLWSAFGCTFGIVPHVLASLVGLSALLNSSAMAFSILKYVGVAYLLFLAWQMWNDKTDFTHVGNTKEFSGAATFRKALLMNILNPKLTIFFLAFLPQFVSPQNGDVPGQMVLLSFWFMVLTLGVFVLYGVLANGFREHILRSPRFLRIMNRSFAGVLAFFGVQLALSDKA